MITKTFNNGLYILVFLHFFKFLIKVVFSSSNCTFYKNIKTFQKKKNLFFKKKFALKTLISKRLSIVLRRKKKHVFSQNRWFSKGRFFFKKFFFRTLLKNRFFLKSFFFLNSKTRQKKITKTILKNQKIFSRNTLYEFNVLNTLLRSHICLFLKDALKLIKNNFVYLNGIPVNKYNLMLQEGDCLQLLLNIRIYNYIYGFKKTLKKKIALFRYNLWKFYKQKFYKHQEQIKAKKRKTPKYIFLFFLFKINTPKFLEVDYNSLSIFFLKKKNTFIFSSYYLNKLFSWKLFQLYNYKKIN